MPKAGAEARLAEMKERVRGAFEAQNQPFDFYGKVVDQDGNALAGVHFSGHVRHWDGVLGRDREILIGNETATDGRFNIHDVTGDAFSLDTVQKDGYELEPCQRTLSPVGGSVSDPVLFKMWRKDVKEPLISGVKSFDIVPDGRRYSVDLTTGSVSESGGGDIRVWVNYTTQIVLGEEHDWSGGIEAVNGGLLEETNTYTAMYVASDGDYTHEFHIDQRIKGGQHGSIGTRRFYVKLKSGQQYGRVQVDLWSPYGDSPGLARIEYAINPTGSRVLK